MVRPEKLYPLIITSLSIEPCRRSASHRASSAVGFSPFSRKSAENQPPSIDSIRYLDTKLRPSRQKQRERRRTQWNRTCHGIVSCTNWSNLSRNDFRAPLTALAAQRVVQLGLGSVKEKGGFHMKRNVRRTFNWIFAIKLLFAVALAGAALLLSCPPSFAGACTSGNLSTLIGVTCDIGSLQFTFTGVQSKNYSINDSGIYVYNTPWTASDFTFATSGNGFALTLSSPQSISTSTYGVAEDYFVLDFSVTDLGGLITGVQVTGGPLSASGTNFSSSSYALYQGYVTTGTNQVSWMTSVTDPGFGAPTGNFNGPEPFVCTPACVPFASGSGTFTAFDLYAQEGGAASWDPSTGFSFSLTNSTVPTPEPSTLLLLGFSLPFLGFMRRFARG